MGSAIWSSTISNIPLNGRNFSSATQFLPGAVSAQPSSFSGTSATERDTSASAGVPSFNGNRQQSNNYLMDGADINESFSDAIGYNPAPEALEEIKVITSNADAEFGNVNGGEVLLSTKGGTNKLHGNVYEYLENISMKLVGAALGGEK